ncbi:hypothetical protein MCOR27_001025 [Pyricularia oryzae]|nr:hypothetical protein MCOR26_006690 [Pyricularia oryzae]KAI6288353.1 hypothetical protein MCOR27_001025 [Pyricularia oryzae]KAI6377482.1 hypothetical protein MCOR32_004886 [Pyricularia oryzae]KAI6392064.1 hypothetical protein MCOR23_008645 [Pyricularia oryzae]KAI6411633.1 hypothetical protein MCOR24_006963 [Pyricularia oryzae]
MVTKFNSTEKARPKTNISNQVDFRADVHSDFARLAYDSPYLVLGPSWSIYIKTRLLDLRPAKPMNTRRQSLLTVLTYGNTLAASITTSRISRLYSSAANPAVPGCPTQAHRGKYARQPHGHVCMLRNMPAGTDIELMARRN